MKFVKERDKRFLVVLALVICVPIGIAIILRLSSLKLEKIPYSEDKYTIEETKKIMSDLFGEAYEGSLEENYFDESYHYDNVSYLGMTFRPEFNIDDFTSATKGDYYWELLLVCLEPGDDEIVKGLIINKLSKRYERSGSHSDCCFDLPKHDESDYYWSEVSYDGVGKGFACIKIRGRATD